MRTRGVTLRRSVGLVLTLFLVAISLGPLSQVSRAASPTTLTFLGPKFDEWEAFITVANRLGKDLGIEVKPEYLPWEDVFKKALIDSKSGVKTWDLVYAYNTWVPGIAASKIFTPISERERANSTTPILSETLMRAVETFMVVLLSCHPAARLTHPMRRSRASRYSPANQHVDPAAR